MNIPPHDLENKTQAPGTGENASPAGTADQNMAHNLSPQMQLSQLLHGISKVEPDQDRLITGLSEDSRTVKSGDLFFARSGTYSNWYEFIDDAIVKGAVAILAEGYAHSDPSSFKKAKDIPILHLEDLAQQIGPIAARFYGHPSRQLKIIGITGNQLKLLPCSFHS